MNTFFRPLKKFIVHSLWVICLAAGLTGCSPKADSKASGADLGARKIREILRQKWALGRTHRGVAQSLSIGLGTVSGVERRARAAGCDVVWLLARADDWPRRWYERIGFVDVGCRWEAVRR